MLAPDVRVLVKDNDSIDLSDLLTALKFMEFPVESCHISYYNYTSSQYIYCGKDPVLSSSIIPCREIARVNDKNQVLTQSKGLNDLFFR